MRNLFLLGSLLVFILGCHSEVAGGGPSGTEAGNAITAQILRGNKTPAVAARVFIMPSSSILSTEEQTLKTTVTDSEGRFSVQDLAVGSYTVEVSDPSGALQFNAVVYDSLSFDRGIDTLRSFSKIQGFVGFASAGFVTVQGMRHRAPVDANGLFSLDSLPSGSASLVFSQGSESTPYYSYAVLLPGDSIEPSSFVQETDRLLLEDFEDMNTQHRFAPYVGDSTGWWFLSAHEEVDVLFVDSLLVGYPLVKEESQYIAFNVTVPETVSVPWVNFGIQIGGNSSVYDLTGLDSVAFKAKGSGTVFFQLIGVEEDSSVVTPWPEQRFDLPSEWTRFAFSVNDFTSNPALLKGIRVVSWVFTSSSDFALDDVELIGLSKEDLWF